MQKTNTYPLHWQPQNKKKIKIKSNKSDLQQIVTSKHVPLQPC